jgi:hypothetical protein
VSAATPPERHRTVEPGTTVVLREVVDGRVRSARPLRVVAHDDDLVVGYLVPRSTVAWPRLVGGAQSQTPDQGWLLPLEEWFGPGSLYVLPVDAGYAAVVFFDPRSGEPTGWKVDFLRPLRRSTVGWDTVDHAFDLLAPLDLRRWEAKDGDDLAQLRRLGLLAGSELARFESARDDALTRMAARRPPFDDRWTSWRPDAGWPPLSLPDGWDEVDGAPPAAGGPRPRRRSAQGIRVLDASGRVWLDLELAGGTLVHGHCPPEVVDALTRQAPLGWALGAGHPAVDALARRLRAVWPDHRWWSGPRPAGTVDLDAHLALGWPPAPSLDAAPLPATTVGWLGPGLFGGLAAGVLVGPPDALAGFDPGPTPPVPSALAAVAALATVELSTDRDRLAATAARAERIRRATGWLGHGPHLQRPAGAAEPVGVLLPADGRGLLATCATDADERELVARLHATVRP